MISNKRGYKLQNTTTYEEFLLLVIEKIREQRTEELTPELCSAVKNNGVQMSGITIKKEGEYVLPNFYLHNQYEAWQKEQCTAGEVAQGILEAYYDEVEKNRTLVQDVMSFEWEKFRDRIFIRLVNREKNTALLADIPHEEYLDMALVYYLKIKLSEGVEGNLILHDQHLKELQITQETLHQAAMKNMQEQVTPEVHQISGMISKMAEKIGVCVPVEELQTDLYVLTNTENTFGAVLMLREDILKTFAEQMDDDFFILPSSVHEVLLLPVKKAPGAEELVTMVKEVNRTQLEETEILSDSVYYFDRKCNAIHRAG